ncbi:Oligopeptide transport system permease OppC [Klebsiella pneumoniae subsp. ozaenae]|uniref:Oligopeptide transport system permease OppC n=1 Tax=Klebsiella pneumoniae subsp. ozaenae TaxID=574 RepID=A0A378BD30_KLEPO|nr:Oligopeptide transport system permease OppC [Klebsiella pneumoniae subsp. ozaenae]
MLGVVVVYASLLVPSMILFESFLSFLGLGTQEPLSSWGALLSDGANSMEVSPWLLLFPAGFLVVTLFCFQLYRRMVCVMPSTRKTAKERCHDHD